MSKDQVNQPPVFLFLDELVAGKILLPHEAEIIKLALASLHETMVEDWNTQDLEKIRPRVVEISQRNHIFNAWFLAEAKSDLGPFADGYRAQFIGVWESIFNSPGLPKEEDVALFRRRSFLFVVFTLILGARNSPLVKICYDGGGEGKETPFLARPTFCLVA